MSGRDTAGTSRRSIAREHVLGATVWAYGGGSAHVKPWTRLGQLSRFQPSRFGGGEQ